jgi:alpha-tubulin suppressor-like RCC1 family protein
VTASQGRHTCGVTIDNLAYCWGDNDNGQLGDGTINNHRKPTPVAGAT